MGKKVWRLLIGTKPLLLRQVRQVQQICGVKVRQQGWDTGETGGTAKALKRYNGFHHSPLIFQI
jgi:hypothetical protein